MAKEKPRRCPVCRSKKSSAVPGGLFRCHGCNGFFDGNPSDGGEALSDDPVRSLELKERAEKQGNRKDRRELKGGL